MLFPLCLDLSQKKCLLVGIGEVGQRKLSTLLKFQPLQVKIIDPMRPLPKEFSHLDNIQFYARPFSPEDLNGVSTLKKLSKKGKMPMVITTEMKPFAREKIMASGTASA